MALFISDTGTVPNPDGWKYYFAATNHMVITRNYNYLYPEVVKHAKANGLAVPTEQEVIDFMCRELYIPCFESSNANPYNNAYAAGLPLPPRLGGCCS